MSSPAQFVFEQRSPCIELHVDGARAVCVGKTHLEGSLEAFMRTSILSGGVLRSRGEIAQALSGLSGNFALYVEDRSGNVLASADKIYSYPVFYFLAGGDLCLGTDPYQMVDRFPETFRKGGAEGGSSLRLNDEALYEFKLAGYVTGGETLVQGLRQLQAGQMLLYRDGALSVEDYYLFHDTALLEGSEGELIEQLHRATESIFKSLIRRAAGRPIWLALSAGLDSRLILCMLKKLAYPNIQTFSYGVPGNHEAAWAKRVAKEVGVPWRFVKYTRRGARSFYATPQFAAYNRFAHAHSTIPFTADVQAIASLIERGDLPMDAVMLNGQTGDFISGGHIPKSFQNEEVSDQDFFYAAMRKHYRLWTHPSLNTFRKASRIRKRIRAASPFRVKRVMSRTDAMKVYECFEWRTRQSAYVTGSQKPYDFAGLDWELPLWDDAYLRFWEKVPFEHKFGQSLYRAYLKEKNFFGLFRGVRSPVYIAPTYARHMQRATRVLGPYRDRAWKSLTIYWQNTNFYYAMVPYATFLRTARYHHNPISYHAKKIVEEHYDKTFF